MIAGIGTDVIETERMRSAILRHGDHFLAHVFTPAEIAAAPVGPARDPYFAARWAAKEAVAKALGTGIGADCAWTDIAVSRGPAGEPLVELSGAARATARRRGIGRIHISLSHERNLAAAMVVAEQGGEPNPHRPDSVAAPTTPAS
jgi:holo-[acyl-carrier protein] synthase